MRRGRFQAVVSVVVLALSVPAAARADAFTDYELTGSFNLPASGVYDVLNDGRLLSLNGANVYVETSVGSRSFGLVGTLPDADMPNPIFAAPAFVRVSPDGSRIAVGNNGGSTWSNFEVGVFDVATLAGDWYSLSHWDAEWIDDRHLALTTGSDSGVTSLVTALDTLSPVSAPINPTLVDNIGGYSGGIAFDNMGNLYTGNGFMTSGPSDTGCVRAFPPSTWMPPLSGESPADFEASGQWVCDLLSAASLGLDAEGNLHVGGGDAWGSGDADYAGLVAHDAVADALAGFGPADPLDPTEVRKLDPDPLTGSFYDVTHNEMTGELYVHQGDMVYTYCVPEPASGLVLLLLGLVGPRRRPRRV